MASYPVSLARGQCKVEIPGIELPDASFKHGERVGAGFSVVTGAGSRSGLNHRRAYVGLAHFPRDDSGDV